METTWMQKLNRFVFFTFTLIALAVTLTGLWNQQWYGLIGIVFVMTFLICCLPVVFPQDLVKQDDERAAEYKKAA